MKALRRLRVGLLAMLVGSGMFMAMIAVAQQPADTSRVTGANFKQAHKYSSDFLKQFTYSTSVEPNWIGKSDSFWYEFRTSKGRQWYLVSPREVKKEPLFDRARLAGQLSEEVRKPLDPLQLPLTRVTVADDSTKLKFVSEGYQFEYDLRAAKLTKQGKASQATGNISPEQQQRMRDLLGEERFREFMERQNQQKKEDKKDEAAGEDDDLTGDERIRIEEILAESSSPTSPRSGGSQADVGDIGLQDVPQEQQKKFGKGGGNKGGFGGFTGKAGDYKNFSPNKKLYAFVKNHNLYVAEADKESEAIQLTKDGSDDYSFSAGGGFGGQQFRDEREQKEKDKDQDKDGELHSYGEKKEEVKAGKDVKTRAPVTWSKDSKSFHVQRRDSRGVKDLFLINSVAEPRPTFKKYPYPMPGDPQIRRTELYVFHADKKTLTLVKPHWKDESYIDLHWGKAADELRFLRRDRLHRNIEFCSYNTRTNDCKCLIIEGFENSSIVTQPIKYLDETDEMIWWSERSGWGHYYLCDRNGKLKNAITAGDFRASAIVATDTKNRILYFRANGREPGENAYFNHLYSVRFDGTGLTLLDPGNGDHDSKLSPTREFLVDNCSRTDMPTMSTVRDARGQKVMDLDTPDLSKLTEIGWRMPETFVVKAADGTTDLYGNLYKPFDFDARKKYPVVAHVYPGPQTESMSHSFKTYSGQQQLAQLGFIVIQVGNRGGTPLRSKAYQSHSYWNMRDYGLADKKIAIEQLAARYPWIDIERIGIYGHSGGGFMSAAALLVKPYNEFFKVAVASAGNHDNNIYNNSWAERYHGMKEVAVTKDEKTANVAAKGTTGTKKGGFRKPDDPQDAKKDEKKVEEKKTEAKKDETKAKEEKKEEAKETRFEIKVPTNPELAANLRGKLLIVHGDMDNNVHPAHTIRLADALIKANKRFDMLILPGKAHGFANYQPYFNQRMWEYFAEHLLGDRPTGTDLFDRR